MATLHRTRAQDDQSSYKYKGTKRSAPGYEQDEFQDADAPGKAQSLYKEGWAGEQREKSYTGQPGGWTGMNYYHEDDGK